MRFLTLCECETLLQKKRNEEFSSKLDQENEELVELRNQLAHKEEQISKSSGYLKEAETEIMQLCKRLEAANKDKDSVQDQCDDLERTIAALENQIAKVSNFFAEISGITCLFFLPHDHFWTK